MSQSEPGLHQDIDRRIHVSIMQSATITASPSSYSKVCDTFRPRRRQGAARRADLGGETLFDFLEYDPVPNGFVAELIAEDRPACICHGLTHSGLDEPGRIHISNSNVVKLTNDSRRKLVKKIPADIGGLGMQFPCPSLLARALRHRKAVLDLPERSLSLDRFTIGQRCECLQTKINTNRAFRRARRFVRYLDNKVQIPVALCVLGEIASVPNLPFWHWAAIEDPELASHEPKRIPARSDVSTFQRNPSQGFSASVAKEWTPFGVAGSCVLLADSIDGPGIQSNLFGASGREVGQIKPCRPSFAPLDRSLLGVVAVVPHEVNRARLFTKKAVEGFNPVAIGDDHPRMIPQARGET